MTTTHQLTADSLSLSYGDRAIIDDLDLEIPAGKVTSIVGANGCGKSTLLKSLARILKPQSGSVLLDGQSVTSIASKRLARTLGLLPQSPIAPDGIAVADLVGRGRHPHQGALARWSPGDEAVVEEALRATRTLELANRPVDELSGGQRQRVWIAMALAQETDILLLDEPTTFLDVTHQVEVLDLVTDLNRDRGTTVVMVLHDLNLAARYSHALVAVMDGKVRAFGTPDEVLTTDLVQEVYGMDSMIISDPVSGSPLVLPMGRHHVRAVAE